MQNFQTRNNLGKFVIFEYIYIYVSNRSNIYLRI